MRRRAEEKEEESEQEGQRLFGCHSESFGMSSVGFLEAASGVLGALVGRGGRLVVSWGTLGRLLGPSWGSLGGRGCPKGAILELASRHLWAPLGALLGRSPWALSWGPLGPPWSRFDTSEVHARKRGG